jgi:ketosteroid isomerase-like protein
MKKVILLTTVIFVLALAVCTQTVELEAERSALRDLDSQLAKAVMDSDLETLVSFYADDASLYPPNVPAVKGHDAIRAFGSEMFELTDFSIQYQNTEVEVSPSGEWGYTLGIIEITYTDPEGRPVIEHGPDFHLWKKQADGAWKISVDMWNSDRAPEEEPLPAT